MKQLIKTLLREGLVREMSDDFEELYYNMTREVLGMIKVGEKLKFKLIPKTQYHKALQDFTRGNGKFQHFPVKYIEAWKYRCLTNIFKLNATTEIFGHTTHFPIDEFLDVFDYNQETGEEHNGEFSAWLRQRHEEEPENKDYINDRGYYATSEFLHDVKNVDDVIPTFSNGQYMMSDYGLEPLLKLAHELDEKTTPEEIIVVINKILDVAHQRSDLAELFIEGGSASLTDISNN